MTHNVKTQLASHYIDVLGSKMHYLDEGQGDPIVFLHGMPTSSYLWRHIIPRLAPQARCIAPDLIGMGKSDKPDIDYTIFDHIAYIDAFIEALGLSSITLVLHGWGSVIGFDYATRHPEKLKGLAFFEAHVKPSLNWESLSLPMQMRAFWLGNEKSQYQQVVDNNYFIEHFLPKGVLTSLDKDTMAHYRAPFLRPADRKVLWQYFCDLPLGRGADNVLQLMQTYSLKLKTLDTPKLMMYVVPGFITPIDTVVWCRDNLPQLTLVDLGEGLHFIQESNPNAFAEAVNNWYAEL